MQDFGHLAAIIACGWSPFIAWTAFLGVVLFGWWWWIAGERGTQE